MTSPPESAFSWRVVGDAARAERWPIVVPPGLETSAEELCAAVRPVRHTPERLELRDLGAEGRPLRAACEAFSKHYGQSVGMVRLGGREPPSIYYPHVTDQEVLLHAPPPFREDAHAAAYLEDLGFAVNRRGRVCAVPLPSVFARRLERLGGRGGLRPELRRLGATLFSPRRWLREVCTGVFPINVQATVSRVLGAVGERLVVHASQREKLNTHFHALGHDMGVHTLAMHAVPRSRMRELCRLAAVALRRGRRATLRAAGFFEERLTRACVEVWAAVRAVSEFEQRFERVFPTLAAELARGVYG